MRTFVKINLLLAALLAAGITGGATEENKTDNYNGTEIFNSTGSRQQRSLGKLARLLFGGTYVTIQLGHAPLDHPLVTYPKPMHKAKGRHILAAIPGKLNVPKIHAHIAGLPKPLLSHFHRGLKHLHHHHHSSHSHYPYEEYDHHPTYSTAYYNSPSSSSSSDPYYDNTEAGSENRAWVADPTIAIALPNQNTENPNRSSQPNSHVSTPAEKLGTTSVVYTQNVENPNSVEYPTYPYLSEDGQPYYYYDDYPYDYPDGNNPPLDDKSYSGNPDPYKNTNNLHGKDGQEHPENRKFNANPYDPLVAQPVEEPRICRVKDPHMLDHPLVVRPKEFESMKDPAGEYSRLCVPPPGWKAQRDEALKKKPEKIEHHSETVNYNGKSPGNIPSTSSNFQTSTGSLSGNHGLDWNSYYPDATSDTANLKGGEVEKTVLVAGYNPQNNAKVPLKNKYKGPGRAYSSVGNPYTSYRRNHGNANDDRIEKSRYHGNYYYAKTKNNYQSQLSNYPQTLSSYPQGPSSYPPTLSQYPPISTNSSQIASNNPPNYPSSSNYSQNYQPTSNYAPTYQPTSNYPPNYQPTSNYPPVYQPTSNYPPVYQPTSNYPPVYQPTSNYPPKSSSYPLKPSKYPQKSSTYQQQSSNYPLKPKEISSSTQGPPVFTMSYHPVEQTSGHRSKSTKATSSRSPSNYRSKNSYRYSSGRSSVGSSKQFGDNKPVMYAVRNPDGRSLFSDSEINSGHPSANGQSEYPEYPAEKLYPAYQGDTIRGEYSEYPSETIRREYSQYPSETIHGEYAEYPSETIRREYSEDPGETFVTEYSENPNEGINSEYHTEEIHKYSQYPHSNKYSDPPKSVLQPVQDSNNPSWYLQSTKPPQDHPPQVIYATKDPDHHATFPHLNHDTGRPQPTKHAYYHHPTLMAYSTQNAGQGNPTTIHSATNHINYHTPKTTYYSPEKIDHHPEEDDPSTMIYSVSDDSPPRIYSSAQNVDHTRPSTDEIYSTHQHHDHFPDVIYSTDHDQPSDRIYYTTSDDEYTDESINSRFYSSQYPTISYDSRGHDHNDNAHIYSHRQGESPVSRSTKSSSRLTKSSSQSTKYPSRSTKSSSRLTKSSSRSSKTPSRSTQSSKITPPNQQASRSRSSDPHSTTLIMRSSHGAAREDKYAKLTSPTMTTATRAAAKSSYKSHHDRSKSRPTISSNPARDQYYKSLEPSMKYRHTSPHQVSDYLSDSISRRKEANNNNNNSNNNHNKADALVDLEQINYESNVAVVASKPETTGTSGPKALFVRNEDVDQIEEISVQS